jgi:hypothetical protein
MNINVRTPKQQSTHHPQTTNTDKQQAPLQGRGLAIPFTKAANPDASLDDSDLRLPFLNKIPDNLRNHFIVSQLCLRSQHTHPVNQHQAR